MESILERARSSHAQLWIDIEDVGHGPAKLYLFNGGSRPPTPTSGDFAYDLENNRIHLYDVDAWTTVTMHEFESKLWNPNGNRSIACFTHRGLPYWTSADEHQESCEFLTVEELFQAFRERTDYSIIHVSERQAKKRGAPSKERGQNQEGEQGPDVRPRPKRPRLAAGLDVKANQTTSSTRLIDSAFGFPEGTPKIQWHGGYETYLPFAGIGKDEDSEVLMVKGLAKRPSLEGSKSGTERCSPDPNSFLVSDLVVEIELDEVLRSPQYEDSDIVETKWRELVDKIKGYMSRSTSVVIRGCTPQLRVKFSKLSMGLFFGDLGMRSEWVDMCKTDEDGEKHSHRITSMAEFIDLADDPEVCGNFLDGKDLNAGIPMWAKPLLDSNTAWEHTMHLRFLKQATSKETVDQVQIEQANPEVIRSGTWTSQGWRLVTHGGYITQPHHDCCGFGTYVCGHAGAKVWAIMRPKRGKCSGSMKDFRQRIYEAIEYDDECEFSKADIVTVCLEEGDIMFQSPGGVHCVFTPTPSIFSGGYFYNYETMHLSRYTLSMPHLDSAKSLTNDHRTGYMRTFCRMVIALRYRSEPRKIGKRSLLSLLLMVLECKAPEKTTSKMKNTLADEERGELAFAAECAEEILSWMNMTRQEANSFIIAQGDYFEPGNEVVVLPATERNVPDLIFQPMPGIY